MDSKTGEELIPTGDGFPIPLKTYPLQKEGVGMKISVGLFFLVVVCYLGVGLSSAQTNPKPSADTEACFECHKKVSPGIVADWERSLHASVFPEEALKKDPKALRVSAK